MANATEIQAMRLAILLAARGLGTTSPNPPVGCVILSDGEIVGTGYHRRKGEAHAEAIALQAAGSRARGATAVVTLEPCNHVGRTPACRQALLDAGISRVVIAVIDPTSRGEGGAAVLRANGVDVEVGPLAEEARLVLEPWLIALELGRPSVTAAYVLDRHGYESENDLAIDLRPSYDVLIGDNGKAVEEGVPNGHGPDAFSIPRPPLNGDPTDTAKALHMGGARSVLLVGKHLSNRYGAAGLVDRVVVVDAAGLTPEPDSIVGLEGFVLRSILRTEGGVRTEWVRAVGT